MLITELLLEAGINTANVHLAALKAMRNSSTKAVKAVIQKYGIEPSEENKWSYVDNIMEWIDKNPETYVLYSFLRVFNNELSHVARENSKKEFPEDFPDVRCEVIEISSDPKAKTSGGYYRFTDHSLVIFISQKKILPVIRSLLNDYIFGEETNPENTEELIGAIGRTFAHEYAHFEQFLRDKRKGNGSDLSFVTLGKSRGPQYLALGTKGGKRGGYSRSPNQSDIENLRYYASRHEIDSFASGTAAELIGRIRKKDETDWNWTVQTLLNSIKRNDGYSETPIDIVAYRNIMNKAFNGKYADIGLNPEEFAKAKKRFEKRVYQKMQAYLKPTAGKADEHDTKFLNKEWVKKAKTLSRADMFSYLSNIVISTIRKEYPNISKEEILSGNNYELSEVESFIKHYYFDWTTKDEDIAKVLMIFRNYIVKKLSFG